jgi:hypothetical protein
MSRLTRGLKLDAVRLKPDEACSHKRHFRGILREVIGYLDMHAQKDREYFVWAEVSDIVEHCQRYHGKRYQQRQVEYALNVLRRMWLVSGVVKRVRGGVEREGRIVTPHRALFLRVGTINRCMHVGPLKKIPGQRTMWTVERSFRGENRASFLCWQSTETLK